MSALFHAYASDPEALALLGYVVCSVVMAWAALCASLIILARRI